MDGILFYRKMNAAWFWFWFFVVIFFLFIVWMGWVATIAASLCTYILIVVAIFLLFSFGHLFTMGTGLSHSHCYAEKCMHEKFHYDEIHKLWIITQHHDPSCCALSLASTCYRGVWVPDPHHKMHKHPEKHLKHMHCEIPLVIGNHTHQSCYDSVCGKHPYGCCSRVFGSDLCVMGRIHALGCSLDQTAAGLPDNHGPGTSCRNHIECALKMNVPQHVHACVRCFENECRLGYSNGTEGACILLPNEKSQSFASHFSTMNSGSAHFYRESVDSYWMVGDGDVVTSYHPHQVTHGEPSGFWGWLYMHSYR